MEIPKQLKDIVYHLLQEPTLDSLREFLHAQMGEHNSIDFKGQWIEKAALAKEVLALANSQGGFIIFGVSENENKSIRIEGLPEIRDKAVVSNDLKNFISSNLKYDVYDFVYDASEYEKLIGKKFQMLVVENTPQFLPFLAKRESGSLKQNMIYVRRGTSCEIANEEELQALINQRMNYLHPTSGKPLELEEHLEQLKILYESTESEHVLHKTNIPAMMSLLFGSFCEMLSSSAKSVKKNEFYPEESYDQFVARMIIDKKNKIERVLDLY